MELTQIVEGVAYRHRSGRKVTAVAVGVERVVARAGTSVITDRNGVLIRYTGGREETVTANRLECSWETWKKQERDAERQRETLRDLREMLARAVGEPPRKLRTNRLTGDVTRVHMELTSEQLHALLEQLSLLPPRR